MVSTDSEQLQNPWLGGLLNPQFGAFDLNSDGISDLIIYDAAGGKVLTFINTSLTNESSFEYRDDFEPIFSEIRNWFKLEDYNCDGLKDLFTSNPFSGGIRLFRAKQHPTLGLRFDLVTDELLNINPLTAEQNPIILPSLNDIPAIYDLDADGDLDLLHFNSSSRISHYNNISLESTGSCVDVNFELLSTCFGDLEESFTSNSISLNIGCSGIFNPGSSPKHLGGSALLVELLNGDELPDLLIGDLGSSDLKYLSSSGSVNSLEFNDVENSFPNYDIPVYLPTFPVPQIVDLNSDGLVELIVSNNGNGLATNQIFLYQNNGSFDEPFVLEKTNFIQEKCLDFGAYSYPTWLDLNGDELLDLIVSNRGIHNPSDSSFTSSFSAYENIGDENQAEFQFLGDDLWNFSSKSESYMHPTFGDLNNDGKKDLILGNESGLIQIFYNTSESEVLEFDLSPDLVFESLDFAVPNLVDLDKDGLLDLCIGVRQGRILFYRNTGSLESPEFELENDFLGQVDTRIDLGLNGFCSPFFVEQNEDLFLYCGSESGNILTYKVPSNISDPFQLVSGMQDNIFVGKNSSVSIADIDNNNQLDLIVGNIRGGLNLYEQSEAGITLSTPEIGQDANHYLHFLASLKQIKVSDFLAKSTSCIFRLQELGTGKSIKEWRNLQGENLISLSQFKTGIYVFSAISNSKILATKKIIIYP